MYKRNPVKIVTFAISWIEMSWNGSILGANVVHCIDFTWFNHCENGKTKANRGRKRAWKIREWELEHEGRNSFNDENEQQNCHPFNRSHAPQKQFTPSRNLTSRIFCVHALIITHTKENLFSDRRKCQRDAYEYRFGVCVFGSEQNVQLNRHSKGCDDNRSTWMHVCVCVCA